MCMCMLQKRTNILFDQEMWDLLVALSGEENKSVGKLVRQAVEKTYKKKKEKMSREKAIDEILALRKHFKGSLDYKELIEHGRKY